MKRRILRTTIALPPKQATWCRWTSLCLLTAGILFFNSILLSGALADQVPLPGSIDTFYQYEFANDSPRKQASFPPMILDGNGVKEFVESFSDFSLNIVLIESPPSSSRRLQPSVGGPPSKIKYDVKVIQANEILAKGQLTLKDQVGFFDATISVSDLTGDDLRINIKPKTKGPDYAAETIVDVLIGVFRPDLAPRVRAR